jgi:hypothetical protein
MLECIRRCSFDQWYPIFTKDTIRSCTIDLPSDFQEFLLEGEFVVEDGMFPAFARSVDNAIEWLGGRAFCKLNFTAPTDAQWMGMNRSLMVKSFQDMIYFLKASTRVLVDITTPFGESPNPCKPILVLKRWFDYDTDREFRVFSSTLTSIVLHRAIAMGHTVFYVMKSRC